MDANRPGNHIFVNGVCECRQRTTDDPRLCSVYDASGERMYELEQQPDHADLVVYLMHRLEAAEAVIDSRKQGHVVVEFSSK